MENRRFDLIDCKDYSRVKEKLFIRVTGMIENTPHPDPIPFLDVDGLIITYHIAIGRVKGHEAFVRVNDQLMEWYGIDVRRLHADAIESGMRLYPAKMGRMTQMMREILPGLVIDPDLERKLPETKIPLVLTNAQGSYGAAALFYPGQLERIAKQLGGDYFVLPSSVHETLILADDGAQDLGWLQTMVREINSAVVAEKDRLSDFVYHYDAEDHIFEKGETFLVRKEER